MIAALQMMLAHIVWPVSEQPTFLRLAADSCLLLSAVFSRHLADHAVKRRQLRVQLQLEGFAQRRHAGRQRRGVLGCRGGRRRLSRDSLSDCVPLRRLQSKKLRGDKWRRSTFDRRHGLRGFVSVSTGSGPSLGVLLSSSRQQGGGQEGGGDEVGAVGFPTETDGAPLQRGAVRPGLGLVQGEGVGRVGEAALERHGVKVQRGHADVRRAEVHVFPCGARR